MPIQQEYRALWSVDGAPEETGSWVPHELLAQQELTDQEQTAQPYTTFVGLIEERWVGV